MVSFWGCYCWFMDSIEHRGWDWQCRSWGFPTHVADTSRCLSVGSLSDSALCPLMLTAAVLAASGALLETPHPGLRVWRWSTHFVIRRWWWLLIDHRVDSMLALNTFIHTHSRYDLNYLNKFINLSTRSSGLHVLQSVNLSSAHRVCFITNWLLCFSERPQGSIINNHLPLLRHSAT